MSSIFGQEKHQPRQQSKPIVSFYLSSKRKDRMKPLLSLQEVTQAFAVYPERTELINKSTLMKIEGKISRDDAAMNMRGREGWFLVMPELKAGVPQANETIRWLIGTIVSLPVRVPADDWHLTAFHDSFSLYGRPRAYSWDPRVMASMMFAYPVGPSRDVGLLFDYSYTLTPKYCFYPVTLYGTRIRRDHGSPGGSNFCYPNAS
jgi:CCR4-NOT transcriptional complex subunit CAF120